MYRKGDIDRPKPDVKNSTEQLGDKAEGIAQKVEEKREKIGEGKNT